VMDQVGQRPSLETLVRSGANPNLEGLQRDSLEGIVGRGKNDLIFLLRASAVWELCYSTRGVQLAEDLDARLWNLS
jgi:hypothetical protein